MAAKFNYVRARAVADRQIKKWGNPAVLRRASGDRECMAMEAEMSASERREIKNLKMRIYLISATDLAVPPDGKIDSLITYEVDASGVNTTTERPPLRQIAPVKPFGPSGYVIYYELTVE